MRMVSSSPAGWRRSRPQGSFTPASSRSSAPLSADTGWVIAGSTRAGSGSGSGSRSAGRPASG